MQGASRGALKASREALQNALAEVGDRAALGEELLAAAGVVGGNVVLRRALSDPSREGKDKAGLAQRLFGDKISAPALAVVSTAVAQRWGGDADLTTALDELGAEALLANAEANDRLERVEDELFRFGRIASGSSELLSALTDRRAPAASRGDLVSRLLGDKAAPETNRLVQHAVAGPRGVRFDKAIEAFARIAAQRQEQLTAVVISAVPLSADHRDRLATALSRHYDRAVHVNVVVDPRVIGGIRVEIGDEVIDGTVLRRLEQARRSLAG